MVGRWSSSAISKPHKYSVCSVHGCATIRSSQDFHFGPGTDTVYAKAVLPRKIVRVFSLSVNTLHLLPVSKRSLPEHTTMDRFEMMTSNSEQIVNGTVDAERTLDLCR
jgi:hypothetical protein